jgi:flavin-dependent dehydrogenase
MWRDGRDPALTQQVKPVVSDVIVIGAGASGCICAAHLARKGHAVLLAEAAIAQPERLADVLCPAVVRYLQSWMPSATVPDRVVRECRGVLAHGAVGDPYLTDYDRLSCGPAWIVRRPAFDRALLNAATAAGAATRLGWKCVGIGGDQTDLEVYFETPEGRRRLLSRAVVVATGRNSTDRAEPRLYHDGQLAYSTTVHTPAALYDLLWVECTAEGCWYMSARPDGGVQLVWVTQARPASDSRRSWFQQAFAATRTMRTAFASEPEIGPIAVADARLSTISSKPRAGVFRIGDAVATSDPLSGQGWMRAVTSAVAVAHAVTAYLIDGGTSRIAAQHEHLFDFQRHVAERSLLWMDGGVSAGRL